MLCILPLGIHVCIIIISAPANLYCIESARFSHFAFLMYLCCFFPAAIVCGFEAPSVMVKEKAGFVTKHISCDRPAPSDFTLLVRTVPETAQGMHSTYTYLIL